MYAVPKASPMANRQIDADVCLTTINWSIFTLFCIAYFEFLFFFLFFFFILSFFNKLSPFPFASIFLSRVSFTPRWRIHSSIKRQTNKQEAESDKYRRYFLFGSPLACVSRLVVPLCFVHIKSTMVVLCVSYKCTYICFSGALMKCPQIQILSISLSFGKNLSF